MHAVEQISGMIIGGSATGILKIWGELFHLPCITIDLHDRIWSIAGNKTTQLFAVGCTGRYTEYCPLRLFDLET